MDREQLRTGRVDMPRLEIVRDERSGITLHTDTTLARCTGIIVAFTERGGGVSRPPFHSLNLAAHVGDDPCAVDANRDRLFAALGVDSLRGTAVTADQVHGENIEVVRAVHRGRGAFANPSAAGRDASIPSTDALVTAETGLPLLMFFADCVPVVLVATTPTRAVAVVHAGWRGALASLPGKAAAALSDLCGCDTANLYAYVGPHIEHCCYNVDERLLSHFRHIFDTIGAVDGRLDLAAAVRESLTCAGVSGKRIASVGMCTRDATDRFFSYRADPETGRHGALAVITEG